MNIKSFSSKKQKEFYNSIENLPIGLWFKIHETQNLELLGDLEISELLEVWEKINNEYLEEFGIPDSVSANLEAKKKAAIYKAKYIIENKRHYLGYALIELQKIQLQNEPSNPVNLEQNLFRLSIYCGFKLSSKDTTVKEYYNYINAIDGKDS